MVENLVLKKVDKVLKVILANFLMKVIDIIYNINQKKEKI